MVVLVTLFGFLIAEATQSWEPFAISVIIAFGLSWAERQFLHQHMHKLYEGEDDGHGIKTIE